MEKPTAGNGQGNSNPADQKKGTPKRSVASPIGPTDRNVPDKAGKGVAVDKGPMVPKRSVNSKITGLENI
ncbi:MAG: hypothetical protein K6U80_19590 [Firmicutes bacterium]|nr:hypothetical protein [Bacillota bacterium]